MYPLATIVGLLFINNIYGEISPGNDDVTKPLCAEQMVRKAFSQSSYPDFEHEPRSSQRYYDPIQEKCLTKVNEPCPEVDATCAPNSECRSINDGGYIWRRCYCNTSKDVFSERFGNESIANWENTYCGTRAGYGEECSDTPPYVACDPKDRLSCHNSKCGCQDPSTMAYDATENRCRLLAGVVCRRDDDCVDNAQCSYLKYDESKCHCPHGTSTEGLCYRGFLQECSTDRPCNGLRSLKCTDGICRCKEPLHQVYEDNKCVVLVGRKCTGSSEECTNEAECVDGICRCAVGFSETADRHCCDYAWKKHGDACENEECDFNKGLACVDGSCQCVDPTLTFDDHTKSCVASIGSKCGILDVVGKGDGKCAVKDDNEHGVKDENTYGKNCTTTCPHYHVSCDGGRPCMQSAAGESYCI